MLHDISSLQDAGFSPLQFAAFNGTVSMISLLLINGANVNQANNDGRSSLHWAASSGHEAAVAILLDNGADVNLANNDGQKPIDVAKNQKIKDILIAHTTKNQPAGQTSSKQVDEAQWFQAAKEGNLAVIQQGINDKIDVNCQDSESRTALWWATAMRHLQLVEYLITQHSDPTIANVSTNDAFLSIVTLTLITLILAPLTCILIPLTSILTTNTNTPFDTCSHRTLACHLSLPLLAMVVWKLLLYYYPTVPT